MRPLLLVAGGVSAAWLLTAYRARSPKTASVPIFPSSPDRRLTRLGDGARPAPPRVPASPKASPGGRGWRVQTSNVVRIHRGHTPDHDRLATMRSLVDGLEGTLVRPASADRTSEVRRITQRLMVEASALGSMTNGGDAA